MKNGAFIMATGRSDYPNTINNSYVFPGIFRAIIDHNIKIVTLNMQIAAA
jgi:malate dehydrogenase (oxaloacetate-decarboxylating)